jgi:large conductance mechanosensitive channel
MLGYGPFITVSINFIIIAWVLFLVVKGMNKLKKQAPAPVPVAAEPSDEVKLLTQIRDALNK